MENNPLIAVCMVCYNQKDYISKAIQSVINQETGYDFCIYIGDDCSTDGTMDICRDFAEKYAKKIKLIVSEQNKGLVLNTIQVLEQICKDGIKYVAMLDGDDYWCNDNKLQEQCEFLEKNEDYGLLFANSSNLINGKIVNHKNFCNIDGNISLSTAWHLPLPNNTVFFRTELLKFIDMCDFVKYGFMSCDYATYVVFSQFTKIKSFNTLYAITRRGHSSVSHPKSKKRAIQYVKNDVAQFAYLADYFANKSPLSKKDIQNHKDMRLFNIAVKFNDFQMANSLLRQNPSIKTLKKGFLYKTKILCAKNKLFFKIWHIFSKLYIRVNSF